MKYSTSTFLLLACACLGFLATESVAQAPPGWRTFAHTKTGIKLHHQKEFQVTPMQPDEHLILARFDRKKPYRAKKKQFGRRPESFIVFVLNDVNANQRNSAPKTDNAEIKNHSDRERMKNDIHTWQEFLKKRFGPMYRAVPTKKRLRDGESEFNIFRAGGALAGSLFVRKVEGQTWGVLGLCDKPVHKYFSKTYRTIARSMAKPQGFVRVRDNSSKFYEGKDLKGIPFRIKARQGMVKGWKATDTKNFFVLYHTKNKRLVNKIVNDLEAIQPIYTEMFPPVEGVEAISVVRICKDIKEYMKYGGPPGSAGYWHFVQQELVFYDTTKDSGSKSKRAAEKDSYIVLYHEGFHQYIFNGLANVSPDYWFNEGMADYFSGCEFYRGSKRLRKLGPNRWRIPRVKRTVDDPRFWISLERLTKAKRAQFYDRKVMGQMYAEAWSLVYFLLRSDEAAKQPGWREIIPTYYRTLKADAARVRKLIKDDMSLAAKDALFDQSRDKSTKAAFNQIDMKKLEAAWMQWIRTMKDPWAAQRRKR